MATKIANFADLGDRRGHDELRDLEEALDGRLARAPGAAPRGGALLEVQQLQPLRLEEPRDAKFVEHTKLYVLCM